MLHSMLKEPQAEVEQLGFLLYTQGLATAQVGEVFEQRCANHCFKHSISRLAHAAHPEILA
ncbi:MAG: hypothetical protein AAF400_00475 [Bacteroidota bacterium]